jgi:hypothetical protein
MEVTYDTVTVITVTRNRSEFLKHAIDSVKKSGFSRQKFTISFILMIARRH